MELNRYRVAQSVMQKKRMVDEWFDNPKSKKEKLKTDIPLIDW